MTTARTDGQPADPGPPDHLGDASPASGDSDHFPDQHPDQLTPGSTILAIAASVLGSGVFTLAAWLVLRQTNLPAFGTSMVTRALATAGSVLVVLVAVILVALWLRDRSGISGTASRPKWRSALTYGVTYLSPAALLVTTTAIPLSATKLYLDGITVDQGFRTQFLTRLTESWRISDMNYIDMPSYYPGGWFWLGGRLANLLGIPGWEVYQPWAIISLAIGGSVLVPVWQRITGSLPAATGIALVTTAVMLVMTPEEPYAALPAMGAPALAALAPRLLAGGRFAMMGGIIYLGLSATFYTLFTGATALSVVIATAVVVIWRGRSTQGAIRPLIRLVVLGVSSILIALIVWGPYLVVAVQGARRSGATAMHYLPLEGTTIPLPMFAPSVLGLLCLIGVIYMIAFWRSPLAHGMAVAVIVFYGWEIASMVTTVTGTTLLGFRLDTLVVLTLGTAGVLGIAELRRTGIDWLYPSRLTRHTSRVVTLVILVVVAAGGVHYIQNIPTRNAHAIDLAYSDTDGDGHRADLFPPDSARYYGEINEHLTTQGFVPAETVVLTDELNFMSYFPYRGFQAFTSHYANPLGEFDLRNEQIEQWANDSWDNLSDPAAFAASMDDAEWHSPDVMILRGEATASDEGWKYDIAEDIYPNNPNVRFRGVYLNPEVFTAEEAPWDVEQIGPFVVVTREH